MERIYDLIVLGGGPAGYTAALYAARAGLDTLVLEKLSAGGQMALTDLIDNYPGFDGGIEGFALGERFRKGAERFGAATILAQAQRLSLEGEIKAVDSSEGRFLCRSLICATGAKPRPLGLEGERKLAGRGISYCAACDGPAYRGKTVAVVGGGNSAAGEALLLSRMVEKLYLVHRRDRLRAEKIYTEPLEKADNLEFGWNRSVSRLEYGVRLKGIFLRDTETGAEHFLPCDGVFVCIGREPETELYRGSLQLDEAGYVIAGETCATNIPGIFAAGDLRTKPLRQAVTAAADGAAAAYFAGEYLAGKTTAK